MKEVWKPIPEYEDKYLISNCGRVLSLTKLRRLNQVDWSSISDSCCLSLKGNKKNNTGYISVGLYKNNKVAYRYVHRLVAEAFVSNRCNKPEVNHKDGNPFNNKADNLEWMTAKENSIHARDVLNRQFGSGKETSVENLIKCGMGPKPVKCVETGQMFTSLKEAASVFKVTTDTIRHSCNTAKAIRKLNLHFAWG